MDGKASSSKTTEARSDDDGTQLTYNETIDGLCGFIKTAIHTILCHRQLYPANVFARRQRYRVPVWASRHPGLNAYIDDVVAAAKVQIQRNIVRSIHMIITSKSQLEVLERYRFDVDFILVNVAQRDRDFSIPGNMTMQTLELQLRAFMMKLISLDGALYDFEDVEDLTWSLILDMKEGCEPQSGDSRGNEPSQGPWVPYHEVGRKNVGSAGWTDEGNKDTSRMERPNYLRANPAWTNSSGDSGTDVLDDAQIVPIKSLDTGVINLMLYVEEHPSAKRRSKGNRTSKGDTNKDMPRRKVASKASDKDGALQAARIGERDIDQPLMQPTSSGLVAHKGRMKKKKGPSGTLEERDEASDSSSSNDRGSESGDSIRSVNDFAGYGKGPGGVGMSGVGM